jgi:hypothetical protein
MKRATHVAAYRNAHEFPMPAGIEQANICTDDGNLASATCLNNRPEFFITGSAPKTVSQPPAPTWSPADAESDTTKPELPAPDPPSPPQAPE